MTKILDEVLAANTKYAENFGDKGNLPLPPSRRFAILTCMDARLDPARQPIVSNGLPVSKGFSVTIFSRPTRGSTCLSRPQIAIMIIGNVTIG
jgi:hypothetical protein